MPTLYYYHDPMCSWCWGFRTTAEQLFSRLPQGIQRVNILGGLAPDSDAAMPMEQQLAIQQHWRRIEDALGTPFNHDFWSNCKPRRSTYPACRAVIAAARQAREEAMIEAIQQAYYLRAMNPSDTDTLEILARELQLDLDRFSTDLASSRTRKNLQQQVDFARRSPIRGFPSLVLEHDGQLIPIKLDYANPNPTLAQLHQSIQVP